MRRTWLIWWTVISWLFTRAAACVAPFSFFLSQPVMVRMADVRSSAITNLEGRDGTRKALANGAAGIEVSLPSHQGTGDHRGLRRRSG
jgi:hypothetical protein